MERQLSWEHEHPQDADDSRHRGPLFKMWGNDERRAARTPPPRGSDLRSPPAADQRRRQRRPFQ